MNSTDPYPVFLSRALSEPASHSLWLHSLSYLEHIGYRKIVKSLNYLTQTSDGVHRHLADEIEHSFIFKKMAEEVSKTVLSKEQIESITNMAENYFQGIDSETDKWVESIHGAPQSELCYIWVSYLVEKRAMKVYPYYHAKLQDAELKRSVQKVILDESEHLEALEKRISLLPQKFREESEALFKKENFYFNQYLTDLTQLFSCKEAKEA